MDNNISNENEFSLNTVDVSDELDMLTQIHTDLGVITCFIALFIVFSLFYVIYKAIDRTFQV